MAHSASPAAASPSTSYLSFYRYTPIKSPPAFREELVREWAPMGVLGRIYVANEGINAQMTIPSVHVPHFVPGVVRRFSLPYAPIVESLAAGESPFKTLHVRVKPQIVYLCTILWKLLPHSAHTT